ncbi:hypothetical protein ACTXT7_001530 [Hymenolepis weldensis]
MHTYMVRNDGGRVKREHETQRQVVKTFLLFPAGWSFFGRDDGENGNTTKQVRFNLHSQTPSSTTSILPHFADSFPRDNLELSVEDEPDNRDFSPWLPQSLPSMLSKSLDLSVLDEPQLSRNLDALSLDVPQINTVRNLQEEVIKLANRVHRAKNSSDSVSDAMQTVVQKRRKETELLGGDGLNVCVNFTPEDRVFNGLPSLDDINDEDLIREERDRFARQRHRALTEIYRSHPPKQPATSSAPVWKHTHQYPESESVWEPNMGHRCGHWLDRDMLRGDDCGHRVASQAYRCSNTEILPEPNLLKFFDPKRHIFQSARLDVTRLPNPQPTPQSLNTPNQLEAVRLDYRLCTELSYYL